MRQSHDDDDDDEKTGKVGDIDIARQCRRDKAEGENGQNAGHRKTTVTSDEKHGGACDQKKSMTQRNPLQSVTSAIATMTQ